VAQPLPHAPARHTGQHPMAVLLVLALSTFAVTVMQTMVVPILSELARSLQITMTDAS
jgi:predicted MFS family arabinose efflux permease